MASNIINANDVQFAHVHNTDSNLQNVHVHVDVIQIQAVQQCFDIHVDAIVPTSLTDISTSPGVVCDTHSA